VLQPVAGCVRPATCFCSLCLRDPPNLFNLASETLFALVVDVHRFRLTANTTHHEYVCTVRSGKVGYARFVPPTYPNVSVMFMSDHLTRGRVHLECRESRQAWHGAIVRRFATRRDVVRAFLRMRRAFWYAACGRGLFMHQKARRIRARAQKMARWVTKRLTMAPCHASRDSQHSRCTRPRER
jgi:hypothetical protein